MKDDSVYLRHVAESIARIRNYTSRGHETFVAEAIVQDAVIRNLEVVGEAVKRISDSTRLKAP